MVRIKVWAGAMSLSALALAVSAPSSAQTELRFRIQDETAPAGGLVQMKVRTTEVTPISGGRGGFRFAQSVFEGVAGIGMFATTGELAGAAVIDGDQVRVAYLTTEPVTGEYPVMTVALRIRRDAVAGTRTSFTLDPSSLWSLNGAPVRARVSPGTVTVGGSVAIGDVIPGQGEFPAGTVVSVRGVGFGPLSRLRAGDLNITSPRFVSPAEMRFTLLAPANLTGEKLRVDNPDGSRSIYYSYLRGIRAATSSRALLAATQPIFSGATRSVSTVGPIPAMNGARYSAIAIQNPNLAGVDVTLDLHGADGTLLYSSHRAVPGGSRDLQEVSELLDGIAPPDGASVRVTSSLPIAVFGLLCDEAAWMVTPQLPAEAAF